MKFYIRQQIFTIGDRYEIKDEEGRTRYVARGRLFNLLGAKFAIEDETGREVAQIEQEIFRLMPRYFVYLDGEREHAAYIAKRFQFLGALFDIETKSGPLRVEGEIFQHEYALYQGSTCVVRISKKWLSWGDPYEIDMAADQDPALILAICVAIDHSSHNDNNH